MDGSRIRSSTLISVAAILVSWSALQAQDRPDGAPRTAGDSGGTVKEATIRNRTAGSQTPAETRLGGKGTTPERPPHGEQRSAEARQPGAGADDPGGGELSGSIVQEPSQGRPIFITPGETFYFVMNLPDKLKGDVSFALRHALESKLQAPLRPTTPPSYTGEYCTLLLMVPPNTAPGLYDLEVSAKGGKHYARRCVKVVDEFKTKFRFVHLSNMNVGDLTAPEFDDTIPREVNLLAPEFIIATGDYTEWARAQDDPSSWQRVLKYFEKFSAPVFMLCGQHDHEASFTRFVAAKPIGTIDYGGVHGLLLLDHPGHPIDQDYTQLQWVEADLRRNRQKRMNFLAANSDELALLDVWRERGGLDRFIKDNRIRLFIVGGSSDWDFREFADRLTGTGDLHYVRTHQASTAMRDGASGIPHYRVIEVDGDKLSFIYPDDNAVEKLQHSIPAGRLRSFFATPNDGSARRVIATVQNALNQPFEDVRLWLRVAKSGGERPSVAPGRLIRALDLGSYWACEVSLDLPDKGAVRVMAAADPEAIPPALPIEIELTGSREWKFIERTTDFGMTYFRSDAQAALRLTNRGRTELTCWPVVRVNGAMLHPDRKAVPKLPITIAAGKSVNVPLVLELRRVSAGGHALQVYLLEDPLSRLTTFNVELMD